MHGFLERVEGIDFAHKVEMGIRADRYKAMVPQVVAPVRLKGRVHAFEAQAARAHTKRRLKFTLPGPMTIADTIADRHYGDKVKMAFAFAELLNAEALALEQDGVDVVQFDEPAFNVFMDEVTDWGIAALERAAQGLKCTTAVHICYGYGIKANVDWKASLGGEWRQYEAIFPAIARSSIKQVSLECMHSKVPISLIGLLEGKDVLVGAIDVASDTVETPEEVAAVAAEAAPPRAGQPHPALHQLRHGPHAAGRGLREAGGTGQGGGAGAGAGGVRRRCGAAASPRLRGLT